MPIVNGPSPLATYLQPLGLISRPWAWSVGPVDHWTGGLLLQLSPARPCVAQPGPTVQRLSRREVCRFSPFVNLAHRLNPEPLLVWPCGLSPRFAWGTPLSTISPLPLTCTPIRPIMMGMAHSRAQPGKTMPDNSLIDAQDRKPVVERKGHRSLRSEPECGQYHEG